MMFVYTLGILEHNSKILLMLRQNTKFFSNYYGLPGGKIEKDESIAGALIRELDEEIGITVKLRDIHFAHCLSWKNEENEEILVLTFKVINWNNKPINKEPYKCTEINWFDIDQIPDNIIPRHHQIIKMVHKSILYSENGWQN